jgi:hypothetical protein
MKSRMPAMELTDEAIVKGVHRARRRCFPWSQDATRFWTDYQRPLSVSEPPKKSGPVFMPSHCRPTQTTLLPIGEGLVLLSLQCSCRDWLKDAVPAKDMKPGS